MSTSKLPAEVQTLFDNNKAWAERVCQNDPEFFHTLSQQQSPKYLWIGCSDSRVPANQVAGLLPGEIFVHRNVANLVVHSDMNCLSVVQFAVDVLKVEHILVCGHYGCGGVAAALGPQNNGLVDNWINHIREISYVHSDLLDNCETEKERINRLCELNVIEQATNLCNTSVVRDAWKRGQKLTVTGVIYGLSDGHLRDLGISIDGPDQVGISYGESIRSFTTSENA